MRDDVYICELKGVTKWFPPDCLLFERVNFHISRNEKVLWTGYAGSGRTSLRYADIINTSHESWTGKGV